MLAHIAGVPVEETLLSFGGAGGCLIAARVWLAAHLRRADRRVRRRGR